ncbi:hypothetical protein AV656_13875 [Bhargavaea cecembensis]|uniref:Peptidase MA-like domain-containing protein n=1 Tax=Bhargavaea cecembensis TaxID=394098 RepID=A0A163EPD9_9BACL|nr:collagenase [Bhargavaea cecembensis]KZE36866.1 hypothetical protein AV656_13875 [Bhargavaea cecembensis]
MVYFVLVIGVILFILGIVSLYKTEQVRLAVPLIALSAASLIAGAFVLIKLPGQTEKILETENALETDRYTIIYPEGQEQKAEEVSLVLLGIEPEITEFFGEDTETRLTVRLADRLRRAESPDRVAGFYDWEANTVTLLSDIPDWKPTLIHEYVHFRSHQYQVIRNISPEAIPIWFEEGLAMYLQHDVPPADPTGFEVSGDLRSMSSQKGFQAALESTAAYSESYFAVTHLIEHYGKESTFRLLHVSTQNQFYTRLEKMTGKSIEDFSESLMEAYLDDEARKKKIENHFYELLDSGEIEAAEQVLAEITTAGSRAPEELESYQQNLLLRAGEYEELMEYLEDKRSSYPDDMSSLNYALLAEVTLLFHPEQASGLVKEALTNLPEDATYYHFINEVAEPYEQIAGTQPLEGYQALFEKEMFFNQAIRTELIAKWKKEFPNEDFGERSGD